jgi:uncharacterized protein with HEPN domain
MIVGEAVWRLSPALKDAHREIPWNEIAGMRHVLVHDYFRVDWNVVFDTASHDLPALKTAIENLLSAFPSDPDA